MEWSCDDQDVASAQKHFYRADPNDGVARGCVTGDPGLNAQQGCQGALRWTWDDRVPRCGQILYGHAPTPTRFHVAGRTVYDHAGATFPLFTNHQSINLVPWAHCHPAAATLACTRARISIWHRTCLSHPSPPLIRRYHVPP